jgi:hypothetical protein
MKYDSKVHDAIIGSQNKWIGIAYEGEEEMDLSCDLCLLVNSCRKCPAGAIKGTCCEGAYAEWCSAENGNNHIYAAIQMLDYLYHLEQWYVLTAER